MGRDLVIPQGPVAGRSAPSWPSRAFAYRSYRLPAALLAGALAGVSAAVFDFFAWYAGYDLWRLPACRTSLLTVVSAHGHRRRSAAGR